MIALALFVQGCNIKLTILTYIVNYTLILREFTKLIAFLFNLCYTIFAARGCKARFCLASRVFCCPGGVSMLTSLSIVLAISVFAIVSLLALAHCDSGYIDRHNDSD